MSITITVGLLLSSLGGLEIEMIEDPRSAPVRAPVVEESSPAIEATTLLSLDPSLLICPSDPPGTQQGIELDYAPSADFPDSQQQAVAEPAGPRRFEILDRELRPDWVGQSPQVKGDGEHWIAVSSDPWKSSHEAADGLVRKVRKAVADYIDEQIGRAGAARGVRLSQADIQRLLGPAQKYREELLFGESSIGVMQQHHAQITFTPQFRENIRQRWREHVVASRLLRTGGTMIAVFVGLIVAFGILKSATR